MEWGLPSDVRQESGSDLDLRLTDEKGNGTAPGKAGGSNREDLFEAFDGAQGHDAGRSLGKVFGATGIYIDVGQYKSADDFAQERHFLVP